MKMALLIVGVIGMVLSMCVVGVSASMPIINGPRASWEEAMLGIVPGVICSSLFFLLAVVGLILVLMTSSAEKSRKKNQRPREQTRDESNP